MKHTLFCYIHLQASGAHGKETMWVEVEKEDQPDRNFEQVASSSWFISEGNGGERFSNGREGGVGGRGSALWYTYLIFGTRVRSEIQPQPLDTAHGMLFRLLTCALLFFRNRYHFLHPKYQLTE